MATTQTPVGPIEKVELKTRQQAIYWRPVRDEQHNVIDWIETLLLPSDPVNRDSYLAKGFRLQRPSSGGQATPDVAIVSEQNQALAAENARLRDELRKAKPSLVKRRTVKHRRKRAKATGDTPAAVSLE